MMTPSEFGNARAVWLKAEDVSTVGFASLLAGAFDVLGTFQCDLAAEVEVAESTVYRWAKGTARPHPQIQKQVIRSLLRRAEKLKGALTVTND
jgi:ribosome-binding protein aMBF1 (putative translation factor)